MTPHPKEVTRDRGVRKPRTRPPLSHRTEAGIVARRDETEPPASSRGRTEARPAARTRGRWSAVREVGKVDRVPLADERARPVVKHLRGRHVVSDAEGEVQVGEPVAAVHGERAHGGSATTRSSSSASCSRCSRRASRCSTVNTGRDSSSAGGSIPAASTQEHRPPMLD